MEPELKKSILEYVLGRRKKLELTGPPRVVATLHEAIEASRDLLSSLRHGVSPKSLGEALERRKRAAERYKNVTGDDWDL